LVEFDIGDSAFEACVFNFELSDLLDRFAQRVAVFMEPAVLGRVADFQVLQNHGKIHSRVQSPIRLAQPRHDLLRAKSFSLFVHA
jgi:hypothetical protein